MINLDSSSPPQHSDLFVEEIRWTKFILKCEMSAKEVEEYETALIYQLKKKIITFDMIQKSEMKSRLLKRFKSIKENERKKKKKKINKKKRRRK